MFLFVLISFYSELNEYRVKLMRYSNACTSKWGTFWLKKIRNKLGLALLKVTTQVACVVEWFSLCY